MMIGRRRNRGVRGRPGEGRAPPERCFTALFGEWSGPRPPSPRQTPPEVFQLLEETGEGSFEEGKRIVRPVIGLGDPPVIVGEPRPKALVTVEPAPCPTP